jgi:hypothetical protein
MNILFWRRLLGIDYVPRDRKRNREAREIAEEELSCPDGTTSTKS